MGAGIPATTFLEETAGVGAPSSYFRVEDMRMLLSVAAAGGLVALMVRAEMLHGLAFHCLAQTGRRHRKMAREDRW